MEDNPPRVSRKDGTRDVSKDGPTGERRCTVDKGGGGDLGVVGCSGKYCKSCAAGMIADCVALCCCPCALVNFLTLVFVKVPWMIGRRCLGRRRKKKKEQQQLVEMRRKCKGCRENEGGIVVERDGNLRRRMLEETSLEIATVFGEEVEVAGGGGGGARSEAERVWFELSQVGHLGFGRVSFTGIEPRDNDN